MTTSRWLERYIAGASNGIDDEPAVQAEDPSNPGTVSEYADWESYARR